MFDRVELKNNAKKILSKNYWWIVLVTLIFGIVSGTGSGVNLNFNFSGNNFSSYSNFDSSGMNNNLIDEYGNINDTYSNDGMMNFNPSYQEMYDTMKTILSEIPSVFINVFALVFIVVFVIALVLAAFVLNPLHVGCKRWFLKNRKEKTDIGEIAHIFSNGYANTVKVMFCRDIFMFLWTLLFIIPGIVKGYEYRMVPYLLAENPEMDRHEAFARSRALMNGNKWDAFVLDISFIGWSFVAGFTCGILSLLYVAPYMELTNTELYVCLCQGKEKYTAANNVSANANL